MVKKLQTLFADYPDVIYAAEHYENYAWGIRAQFYDDRTESVISMMVYGPANTRAQLQRVLALVES